MSLSLIVADAGGTGDLTDVVVTIAGFAALGWLASCRLDATRPPGAAGELFLERMWREQQSRRSTPSLAPAREADPSRGAP